MTRGREGSKISKNGWRHLWTAPNIGGALRPYTYHQPTSHEERIHSQLRFVDRLYPTTYIVTWPKIRIFKFLVLIKQFAIGKNFFDQKSYWNLRLRKNHKLRFAIVNRMDQFIQLLLRRRGAILTKYLQNLEAYAWWNALAKHFKIGQIFGIRKPTSRI